MKWESGLLLLVACFAPVDGALLRAGAKNEAAQPADVDMAKVTNMMKAMDGKMNFGEFQEFIKAIAERTKDEPPPVFALQAMFTGMDADKDKSVTIDEFMSFKEVDQSPQLPAWAANMPAGLTPPMAPMAPVAAAVGLPAVQPAFGAPAQSTGLKCVAWRKTTTCMPSGPRDPLQDKDCLTLVGSQESGFCECEGYVHTSAVTCGHTPVNCEKECGAMQKMHRESFGADSQARAATSANGLVGNAGQNGAIPASKDPYSQALQYGQKAMKDVNSAVDNSNQLLGAARNMISKMMNLKPWAEITKLGKDAEEAGKKTEMLSKLARPFIYAQVEETSN